jgi:hypothetical protein
MIAASYAVVGDLLLHLRLGGQDPHLLIQRRCDRFEVRVPRIAYQMVEELDPAGQAITSESSSTSFSALVSRRNAEPFQETLGVIGLSGRMLLLKVAW